ncbi:fluoride efflux transporter CrcB [Halegenticoccus tardaugens]|uniref:fluoride efflux transporter CrcB n=1 Tax=Halegenticoccus tardaugens TaxID=2071624 RepID=UPI00100B53B5|nr:fluoride efflux transporter CrcB [Halegenticoccus tardaugens]
MDPAHLVGTGGALGALLRHAVYRAVDSDRFPTATLAVNAVGSFALGLVAFGGFESDLALFAGTGACGSFTTYSTFSFETVQLWEDGHRARAASNAAANLSLCLAAIGLARVIVPS